MELRFVQVDVFTDRALNGNALAVFTDGDKVPERLMQPLAREMNLSETTFVQTPDDPSDLRKVRIFTPGSELPFAGHPTIGTSYVLATSGVATESRFTLQEKIGTIPVTVEGELQAPGVIWMEQPLPTFSDPYEDRNGLASRLGIGLGDLLDIPIRVGSAGVPFAFVGLRTPEIVDMVSLADRDLAAVGGQGVFLFAPIEDANGNEVHSRMLGSHGLGIVEDPATGGASGPLGAFLIREGVFAHASDIDIISRQGYAMGRPSEVHIRLGYEGDRLTRVQVGGRVVPVLEGTVRLD